jgi:predicted GNAT family acetyltransferase
MSEDTESTIERTDTKSGGAYRLKVGKAVAEMTFSRASDRLIIIDHTEVPEALRGRRIGNLLLERAIADARASGGKIYPLCPFAAAQFQRHPEYQDVLSR